MRALARLRAGLRLYNLAAKARMLLAGGVVKLRPKGALKGHVLFSYITLPFTVASKDAFDGHTNLWECRDMAHAFLERGYAVDVIDWTNKTFTPKKRYTYFLDIHANMERVAPLLNKDCVKILHTTGAHFLFHNTAEYQRLLDVQKRRAKTLIPRRAVVPSYGIEHADVVTMLGNEFTEGTYAYAGKHIIRIPLSSTHTYPSPAEKNFERARKGFVWFGGSGMVHKGLDLVLEAFAHMPECQLTICGKVANEKDFVEAYKKELYETPNIRVAGLTDPGGDTYKDICTSAVALVYPSSSEGQSGAVITTMHAGLIPIISYQSGVDVEDFGSILTENTIEEIRRAVRAIASLPDEELRARSMKAWHYARGHHTREKFAAAYRSFVDMLEKSKK